MSSSYCISLSSPWMMHTPFISIAKWKVWSSILIFRRCLFHCIGYLIIIETILISSWPKILKLFRAFITWILIWQPFCMSLWFIMLIVRVLLSLTIPSAYKPSQICSKPSKFKRWRCSFIAWTSFLFCSIKLKFTLWFSWCPFWLIRIMTCFLMSSNKGGSIEECFIIRSKDSLSCLDLCWHLIILKTSLKPQWLCLSNRRTLFHQTLSIHLHLLSLSLCSFLWIS